MVRFELNAVPADLRRRGACLLAAAFCAKTERVDVAL